MLHKIRNNLFFLTCLRWLKKQYVIRRVKKKGYYVSLENSALESNLIALYRGYCIWNKGECPKISFHVGEYEKEAKVFTEEVIKSKFIKFETLSFQLMLDPQEIPVNNKLEIHICFENGSNEIIHTNWQLTEEIKSDFISKKNFKLEKLKTIIQCPVCQSHKLNSDKTNVICASCNNTFTAYKNNYNFLTGELRELGNVTYTENISANQYDRYANDIIVKFKDGLILDNGAGLRGSYEKNVVNFEITDYPTTDVIGIGESLPFKDESFDAAFSLNVMEHVKNPFRYAEELKRVVKKGGIIYAAVPFLQPYHGYPHHYFNMTSAGLESLFENNTRIIEKGVVEMGHPIFAVSWILNEYINGLPARQKRKFSRMRVNQLAADPLKQLEKDYTRLLAPRSKEIISCVNFVVCEKE